MAIYLDHAATTPLRPEVLQAMVPYLTEHFGNPSSLHAAGRRARQGLDEAREAVAVALGAKPREIVFTSGASENTSLAINGIAWAQSARGRHLVTTAVEHRAVLNTCGVLERHGFQVTYLPVDRYGQVDPAAVAEAIGPHTTLVAIGYANNEVGTIQPIADIGAICRERKVAFFADATQAAASLPLDVDSLEVDLLGIAAHKIEGPKGVGALFVRQGTNLIPQQQGGSQERQRRAGTENVAGAVGLGEALRLARSDAEALAAENDRQRALRGQLTQRLEGIPDGQLTGHPEARLPNSVSWVFRQVEGGDLVAALDLEGVAASTGSACTSGSAEPSHVLGAMGVAAELIRGSLRLTLGRTTTGTEVDEAADAVVACVARVRSAAQPVQADVAPAPAGA
ncbi:MAG: cysteine desulfurase family protein [Candidatus Limnocylindria bacterium]